MAASQSRFSDCVFINCPFDRNYLSIFEALTFTIIDTGFVPRCTLDAPDSGAVRVGRIQQIIETSRYSIHDISRVELSPRLAVSRRTIIPGPQIIRRHFAKFCDALPRLCDKDGLDRDDILFLDYVTLAQAWIRTAQ